MNELIEEMLNDFEDECSWYLSPEEKEKFKQAIQTACKAQRNACAKVYNEVCLHSSIPTTTAVSLIKNAEIERQDYE